MIKAESLKQASLSFVASYATLGLIFVYTSNKHYGHIDYEYYKNLLPIKVGISILPAFVALAVKSRRWYWSMAIGVIVGFLGAVAYVQLSTNI